jgi:Asp-tRNA(Asn)/Glu-tRNA(Gln) amidotransferase A subunit family amidase
VSRRGICFYLTKARRRKRGGDNKAFGQHARPVSSEDICIVIREITEFLVCVKTLGFWPVQNSVARMKHSGRVAFIALSFALASLALFSGCSALPGFGNKLSGNRAFIKHWAPDPNSKELRLAVKDNIDMKGVITTDGSEYFLKTHEPAAQDAACLELARARNVQIVGKTNLTEFAVSPSGFNEYFGTPKNPLGKGMIPGGSSSGNAVALTSGMADTAFGTDSAGSIRVPAACCGVVGLKTTYGLIPLKGVYPIEPAHLDTVGPMGKDIEQTAKGMDLLEDGFARKYAAAKAARPNGQSIRIGRLQLKDTDPNIDAAIDHALIKTGFRVIQLADRLREKWEQAKKDGNTVASAGAWINDQRFQFALGVSGRTKAVIRLGQITYTTSYRGALARQHRWQQTLGNVFESVDFIALPTLQTLPPSVPINLRIGLLEAQMLTIMNTVAVNFAGNPALAMPVPVRDQKSPVTSLQLIGPPFAEAELLNAGRLVEETVNSSGYLPPAPMPRRQSSTLPSL